MDSDRRARQSVPNGRDRQGAPNGRARQGTQMGNSRQGTPNDRARQGAQNSGARRNAQGGRRQRRRRMSGFYKFLAVIFIVVIIIAGAFFVRNLGAGNSASEQGMIAYENGNYGRAITYFGQAIDRDSNNLRYWMQLGMAQIKNAEFDNALATFSEMRDMAHSDTDRQSALRGSGIACLYKGDYAEAVRLLTEAMSYAGNRYTEQEMDISYYLAEAQDKSGDPVEAVLTYTKILEQKESADTYLLRGIAYQKVGDNTSAETDLYKAIDLNGKDYKAYLTLYEVLTAQGKTREAEKLLQEAVTLPVRSSEDYSNRGYFYMYMDEYELSAADFDRAIEDDYEPAYFGKANLMMEQGKYEEAAAGFDAYFSRVHDNALAYNQYGVCMMRLGSYDKAAEAFANGLALNDWTVDRELRYNEMVAYERLGQWAQAYQKAVDFLQKYPDDAQVQRELGFLESRQK